MTSPSDWDLKVHLLTWRNELAHGRPAPDVVCDFVLSHCARLNGGSWLGSPTGRISGELKPQHLDLDGLRLPQSPRTAERLKGLSSREELIRRYHLKGVRLDSHLGLLGWLEQRYPLELRLDQPTPHEMLDIQCEGRRYVTLFLEEERQLIPIGRHAGAYEFLLHDLEHAEKFFGGAFSGQVTFFCLVRRALQEGLFNKLLHEERFAREFDYLISDMNSHPVHLVKYLKAIVLDAYKRGGGGSRELIDWSLALFALWELPEHVKTCAMRLNFPSEERESDRLTLSHYFSEVGHEVRA